MYKLQSSFLALGWSLFFLLVFAFAFVSPSSAYDNNGLIFPDFDYPNSADVVADLQVYGTEPTFIVNMKTNWTRTGVLGSFTSNTMLYACDSPLYFTKFYDISTSTWGFTPNNASTINSQCHTYLVDVDLHPDSGEPYLSGNYYLFPYDYNQDDRAKDIATYGVSDDNLGMSPPSLYWAMNIENFPVEGPSGTVAIDTFSIGSGSSRSWVQNDPSYWIEFYSGIDRLKVYSFDPCSLDITNPALTLPLTCNIGNVYEYNGDTYDLVDLNSPFTFNTPDFATDDYCTDLIKSNYSLIDQSGTYLCKATDNSATDFVTGWFDDKIDEITLEDWGTFSFLKNVMLSILEAIRNSIQVFANVVLPNSEDFRFFTGTVQDKFAEKFPEFEFSGLTSLTDSTESSTLDVTMFGVNETIDVSNSFVDTFRPYIISVLAFFITVGNITRITKLLGDYDTSNDL